MVFNTDLIKPPRNDAQNDHTVHTLLRGEIGRRCRIPVGTAVHRQTIHRLTQIGNRPIGSHSSLKDLCQIIFIKIQIRCLQDKIFHSKMRLVVVLHIMRCHVLDTDIRARHLRRNICPRTRERRRCEGGHTRPRKPYANRSCQSDTSDFPFLPYRIHSITHDRFSTPKSILRTDFLMREYLFLK